MSSAGTAAPLSARLTTAATAGPTGRAGAAGATRVGRIYPHVGKCDALFPWTGCGETFLV